MLATLFLNRISSREGLLFLRFRSSCAKTSFSTGGVSGGIKGFLRFSKVFVPSRGLFSVAYSSIDLLASGVLWRPANIFPKMLLPAWAGGLSFGPFLLKLMG